MAWLLIFLLPSTPVWETLVQYVQCKTGLQCHGGHGLRCPWSLPWCPLIRPSSYFLRNAIPFSKSQPCSHRSWACFNWYKLFFENLWRPNSYRIRSKYEPFLGVPQTFRFLQFKCPLQNENGLSLSKMNFHTCVFVSELVF